MQRRDREHELVLWICTCTASQESRALDSGTGSGKSIAIRYSMCIITDFQAAAGSNCVGGLSMKQRVCCSRRVTTTVMANLSSAGGLDIQDEPSTQGTIHDCSSPRTTRVIRFKVAQAAG